MMHVQESVLHYDVIGHPQCDFRYSVAFPFHPATPSSPAQVTLVQEYAQVRARTALHRGTASQPEQACPLLLMLCAVPQRVEVVGPQGSGSREQPPGGTHMPGGMDVLPRACTHG